MDYVYVVTVTARGEQMGEFFGTPTAFEEQTAAELAALVCRQRIGGHFARVDVAGVDPDHVAGRWDSDKVTVWLERLIFERAQ